MGGGVTAPVKTMIGVPVQMIQFHGTSVYLSVSLVCSLRLVLIETSLVAKERVILLFECVVGRNALLYFMMYFLYRLVSMLWL